VCRVEKVPYFFFAAPFYSINLDQRHRFLHSPGETDANVALPYRTDSLVRRNLNTQNRSGISVVDAATIDVKPGNVSRAAYARCLGADIRRKHGVEGVNTPPAQVKGNCVPPAFCQYPAASIFQGCYEIG